MGTVKLKAFIAENYDGRFSTMVAGRTLPQAAKRMFTSAYDMRRMGWRHAEGADAALALANPDIIFRRPIDSRLSLSWDVWMVPPRGSASGDA